MTACYTNLSSYLTGPYTTFGALACRKRRHPNKRVEIVTTMTLVFFSEQPLELGPSEFLRLFLSDESDRLRPWTDKINSQEIDNLNFFNLSYADNLRYKSLDEVKKLRRVLNG